MLTQTTETAIKALIFLATENATEPVPLMTISDKLKCSPTYLSKIVGHLAKDGILKAHRGAKGGMTIARPAKDISLFEIVQACQGFYLPSFCDNPEDAGVVVCGFHHAMYEVRHNTVEILTRWKLSDLAARPAGNVTGKHHPTCKMRFLSTPDLAK